MWLIINEKILSGHRKTTNLGYSTRENEPGAEGAWVEVPGEGD